MKSATSQRWYSTSRINWLYEAGSSAPTCWWSTSRRLPMRRQCCTFLKSGILSYSKKYCRTQFSFSTNVESNETDQIIREAYLQQGTDGILGLFSSAHSCGKNEVVRPTALPVHQLWKIIHQAAHGEKGMMASILNAWIAGCCFSDFHPDNAIGNLHEDHLNAYNYAFDLFRYATADNPVMTVTPDVVTYSLLYCGCPDPKSIPNNRRLVIWSEAQKLHRQQRGPNHPRRRHKVLFQNRNQSNMCTASDSTERLQFLLGSDFEVLYENDDWVVINKPAGVTCSHKHKTTAGKIPKRPSSLLPQNGYINNSMAVNHTKDISVEDALMASGWSLSTWNPEVRGLVHRLDRGTSGCMAWAKHDAAHAQLVVDWYLRRVKKTYQCIVSPIPTHPNLQQQHDDFNSATRIPFQIESPVHGKPARSEFRILNRFRYRQNDKFSSNRNDERKVAALLEVQPFTGRKHQVRIHCARDLGCPIWGEDLHCDANENTVKQTKSMKPEEKKNKRDQRFFLHALSLSIPYHDKTITVEAPLPDFWDPSLENWEYLNEQNAKNT